VRFLQNKLLLIGSGNWPKKIASIVNSQSLVTEISHIGAREFLKLETNQVEILLQASIVWIATTPENQLIILEKIKGLSNKVIIEKPIALSLDQLNRLLTHNRISRNKLYVSEPWRHSEIWNKAKNRLTSVSGLKELQISRGGPIERDYIDPPWDWMQHDLGLLSELLLTSERSLKFQCKFLNDRKNLKINIESRDKYQIEINLGLFQERTEKWILNDKLFIDFADRESFNDQPVFNMFESICNDKFSTDLESQVWLTSEIITKLEDTKPF
jgi:hypothetical protein